MSAAAFVGADFTAVYLTPLKVLNIPYPHAMDYANWIAAAGCTALWLVALLRWPRVGSVVAVVLCYWLIGLIPGYGERRIARIPVRRWVDFADTAALESTLKFAVTEQLSRDGTFVVVAPQNEQPARDGLQRMGLLAPGTAGGS